MRVDDRRQVGQRVELLELTRANDRQQTFDRPECPSTSRFATARHNSCHSRSWRGAASR